MVPFKGHSGAKRFPSDKQCGASSLAAIKAALSYGCTFVLDVHLINYFRSDALWEGSLVIFLGIARGLFEAAAAANTDPLLSSLVRLIQAPQA